MSLDSGYESLRCPRSYLVLEFFLLVLVLDDLVVRLVFGADIGHFRPRLKAGRRGDCPVQIPRILSESFLCMDAGPGSMGGTLAALLFFAHIRTLMSLP